MSGKDDAGLRQARRRVAELASAITRREREMASLGLAIAGDRKEMARLQRFIDQWHAIAGRTDAPATVAPRNPDRREVAALALAEIAKARRPIARRELHQRLKDGGLELAGKDPEMVLGTMLYRDDRIVRLKGHGYWPAGQVYEPAFYWPEHEGVVGAIDTTGGASADI